MCRAGLGGGRDVQGWEEARMYRAGMRQGWDWDLICRGERNIELYDK